MERFVKQADASPLVDYSEVPDADHMTFLLGKDLSYFTKVIDLVDAYNRRDEKGR
jgi:hypothetical protein